LEERLVTFNWLDSLLETELKKKKKKKKNWIPIIIDKKNHTKLFNLDKAKTFIRDIKFIPFKRTTKNLKILTLIIKYK